MRIFFLQLLFSFSLLSCGHDGSGISIKPLHPYSSSPYYYQTDDIKDKEYVIKYFFIEGANKATDDLAELVDQFVVNKISSDSDFVDFGGYYMDFYKKTNIINEKFREQTDGIVSNNLLNDHTGDLLFRYTWAGKEFLGCEYFKNGKIIKTEYDKEKNHLRGSSTVRTNTGKISIREVPQ